MPRRPQNPPLDCTDCDEPVIKTSGRQYVCVGCGRTYEGRQPTAAPSGRLHQRASQ